MGALLTHRLTHRRKESPLTNKKSGIPLVAKLQSAPDSAWSDLLNELEEAKSSYDPETQTGGLVLQAGDSMSCRTSSSGRAIALTAEDEGKGLMLGREGRSQSYRASSSGGASPFVDGQGKDTPSGRKSAGESYRASSSGRAIPDTGKETLPDRAAGVRSYRAMSSGGAGPFTDGGKGTPAGS